MIWHRFSGGVQSKVVGEGTHFRIPLITYPTIFDVRLKPRVIASRTGTKDLQQVQISLRVLSRPDSERLPEIFRNLGESPQIDTRFFAHGARLCSALGMDVRPSASLAD